MIFPLTPEFMHTDERGKLVQLISSGYVQVNVLTSQAGTVRGNHYHKHAREAFYVVSGCVEVCTPDQKYEFSEGEFFAIEPPTMHALAFLKDCILVVLYDRKIELENGEKDIYN